MKQEPRPGQPSDPRPPDDAERLKAELTEAAARAATLEVELDRERHLTSHLRGQFDEVLTLARETERLVAELGEGNTSAPGGATDTAAPWQPPAPPPARVLFVVTAPLNAVHAALNSLRGLLGRPLDPVFLVSSRDHVAEEGLRAIGSTVIHGPASAAGLLSAALRHRRRPAREFTVVFLTGGRTHRRLKLMAWLIGAPRLLIFNETGGCFFLGPTALARHVRWRADEFFQSSGHRLFSAWRYYRAHGGRAFARRLQGRAHVRTRGLAARGRFLLSQWNWSRVSLPATGSPVLSIVIPAHNKWAVTRRCLRSIAAHTNGVEYEVLLVDDSSTDQTRRAHEIVPGLRRVATPSNVGFVDACNLGAREARGRFLFFLNNDTVVTSGWWAPFARHFDTHPRAGAAGAKLVYPDGSLQEAGGIVWREGKAWNYARHDDPGRHDFNYLREVDYCSGAALAVRREAFDEVGGFDRRFAPGYWEDVDLCFSLRDKGWSVWYQPASVVCHFEGVSSGTDEAKGMKKYQAINRDKFHEKWKGQLEHQPPFDLGRLFAARDRRRGPLVLVFDHYVPMPDRDAGSLFMHTFVLHLHAMGCRVVFWPDNLYRLPGYAEALEQEGIQVVHGPVTLRDFLDGLGRRIDAAIVYRSQIAAKYLEHLRPLADSLAYIAVDLEALREQRRAELTGTGLDQIDALWQRETEIVRLSDFVGVHSPVERDLLAGLGATTPISLLPLPAVSMPPGPLTFQQRSGLLFVGSTHPPNVDAIRYFVSDVWPLVREAVPDATLRIVGDVCGKIQDLSSEPGLELVGHLPDLAAALNHARVFVAPLRYGAGIKGKVLTAMNAGVPVITSSVGAEGIGIEHSRSALIADDAAEFARCVVELHGNAALWNQIRTEALRLALDRFSSKPFERAVEAFMGSVLSRDRSAGANFSRGPAHDGPPIDAATARASRAPDQPTG